MLIVGVVILTVGIAVAILSINVEKRYKAAILVATGLTLFALGTTLVKFSVVALRTHKVIVGKVEFTAHADSFDRNSL